MNQSLTHPTDAALSDFQLGKLGDPEHADIEAHLAECPACQGRAAAVRCDDTLVHLLSAGARWCDAAAETPAAATEVTQGWTDRGAPLPEDETAPASLAGHHKYQAVRRLGAGGMGTVWLAEHAVMSRSVAVKVIRPDLLTRPGATDRFLREVRAAARLHHPNIVTAYDAEPAGDSCLLVMEYVEGETLADRVKAGPLPVAEACRAVRDAARGLAHAHAAGLVHRDVKPGNLMRAADGTVKVLDFGLAGVGGGELAAGGDGLTGAGMVYGTPDYIAPEQIDDAHAADARADVYGLGCTLYHLLAGRPPFADGSVVEKLEAHRTRQPDPIPGLPTGLAAVLTKMLAKRPEDRFQTADDVAVALDGVIAKIGGEGSKAKQRRRRWLAVAAGLLFVALVVAAGVIFKIQRDNQEITIQTDDLDVEVVMKRKGEVVRVIDHKSGQTWEIDTAANQIGLADTPNGLRFELPEGAAVVMKRKGDKDGRPAFTVARVVNPAQTAEVRKFGVQGHGVIRLALSSDEQRMLSAGCDGTARYWEVTTGKEIHTLKHNGQVWGASITPDGSKLLTGGDDKLIHVWDARTGKELKQLKGHASAISDVAVAPNGKFVASSGLYDFSVRLWNLETGEALATLEGHTEEVVGVAFSPDGTRLASWGKDRTVRLWDVKDRKEVHRLDGHTEMVRAAKFSPDGAWLVSGSYPAEKTGSLIVWDVASGKSLKSIPGIVGGIHGLSVSADGRRALTGGPASRVQLWNLETGEEIVEFKGQGHRGGVSDVAFLRGDRAVSSGGIGEDTFRVWGLPGPVPEKVGEVRKFAGHKATVWGVAFLPDERRALSCGEDGFVRCWELKTGTELWAYDAKIPPPEWKLLRAVAVSPDGTRALVASYDPSHTVRVLDTATGKEVGRLKGHKAWVHGVSFSSDGRRALSVSHTWDPRYEQDRTVRMWEVATGKELRQFEVKATLGVAFTVCPTVAVFSNDDRFVLSGYNDGSVREWDTETGKERRTFEGHSENVLGIALTADGTRMLTGGYDKVVRLWDVKTGKELSKFEGHTEKIPTVSLTADGRRALTAGEDGTVRLWDVDTGKEVYCCEGHADRVQAAAITRDGRYALSGSKDGTVRLWRLPDPAPEKGGVLHDLPWPGSNGNVYYTAFSPDGKYVLAGSDAWDPCSAVWETATGKLVAQIPAPAGAVFLPDGKQVLAARGDGQLVLWDLATDREVRRFPKRPTLCWLSVSADGSRAVSYHGGTPTVRPGSLTVWDVARAEPVTEFDPGHEGGYLARISPDGKRVVTVSQKDRLVRVWDVAEKKVVKEWTSPEGSVYGPVTFLPDGKGFITTSDTDARGRVARFDEKEDAPVWLWDDKTQGVTGVSPDGRVALVYNGNRTVRVFALVTGKELGSVELPSKVHGYMAVSPDGRYGVATATEWQTKAPARVYIFRLPEQPAVKP